jgi:hypothetical protein
MTIGIYISYFQHLFEMTIRVLLSIDVSGDSLKREATRTESFVSSFVRLLQ